ncbi:hypothetical protein LT330_004244 [Penicillium expansum]|nr:hypothetical protein LT330_004244 [Penicillium expansum]
MYRGERRQEGMEAIALTNALAEERERRKSNARREAFQEGDLVLFGPRKIIKINPGRVSAQVTRLYGSKTSKYHLDDLRLYFRRENEDFHYDGCEIRPETPTPAYEGSSTEDPEPKSVGGDGSAVKMGGGKMRKRRVVVPQALLVLRLRPGRRDCAVGRLSHEVGWKYQDVVSRLEKCRKVKSKAYYERKKATRRVLAKVVQGANLRPGSLTDEYHLCRA